jgi:DNA-binding beta-propeller fold protein YncE
MRLRTAVAVAVALLCGAVPCSSQCTSTFESRRCAVQRLAGTHASGAVAVTVAPSGSTAATAVLAQPAGAAVSLDGRVFFADAAANVVYAVNTSSGRIAVAVGSGAGVAGFADGDSNSALLSQPAGLALSADGTTLYVCDKGNNRIRALYLGSGAWRAAPRPCVCNVAFGAANHSCVCVCPLALCAAAGMLATVAGSGSATPASTAVEAEGAGLAVAVTSPAAVAVGSGLAASLVFFVDSSALVRVLNRGTGQVYVLCGTAWAVDSGAVDGLCGAATFSRSLTAVAFDDRRVFVADRGYSRIRVIAMEPYAGPYGEIHCRRRGGGYC